MSMVAATVSLPQSLEQTALGHCLHVLGKSRLAPLLQATFPWPCQAKPVRAQEWDMHGGCLCFPAREPPAEFPRTLDVRVNSRPAPFLRAISPSSCPGEL